MCNCVEQIKQQLIEAKVNTTIDFININLFTEQPVLTYEYKKGKSRKKNHGHVVFTYCPFCGKKYEERKLEVKNEMV